MQKYENMVCAICEKQNQFKHQDFCIDLGCSGEMIKSNTAKSSEREILAEILSIFLKATRSGAESDRYIILGESIVNGYLAKSHKLYPDGLDKP